MRDRLACTSFSLFEVLRVGPGMAGWTGSGRWCPSGAGLGGRVPPADDLVHRDFHRFARASARAVAAWVWGGGGERVGTLTRSRRRVAPRATAWLAPARVPAARSTSRAITAQPSQAQLAANSPDGICASGPSIKSAKVVSMMAWRRWVMSASAVGSGVGHKRVITPHRKQRVGVAGVLDAAHHQPHGDRAAASPAAGCRGFRRPGHRRSTAPVSGSCTAPDSAPGCRRPRRWPRSRR